MRFWFVQGDAVAGVEAVDEGRRRQSLGALERCEERRKMRRKKEENGWAVGAYL